MSNIDAKLDGNQKKELVSTPSDDKVRSAEPMSYYERLRRTEFYKKLRLPMHYITSYYNGRKQHETFQGVKTYCLFVGHGRSGHSIVGALIDAHPNAIIPDELDTLLYISAGFNKDQVCHLLLAKSQAQARRGRRKRGREGKVYSYQVPDQWQGRFDKLQVVGDSQAGISVQRLARNPDLWQRLQNTLSGVNIKTLLIVRNPYDNISTLMLRGGRSFENAIDRYFTNCETIADLQKHISDNDFLVMRQEEFLDQPELRLNEICNFLDLETSQDYLKACAAILYKSPAQSRHKLEWNAKLIDLVRRKIDQFDFLAGYSYEH